VGDFDLTTAQADQLAEELRGERLLWAGTGSAAPRLPLGIQLHTTGGESAAGRAATTCFAIPWTAFALFWMAMASQASWLFAMFGLPFVLIGLVMLFGPWLGPRLQRSGVTLVYAVTERRALILGDDGVQSFPPERLGHVQRRRRGALSDLIFARELEQSGGGVGQVERGFLGVADAEAALTVLEALKASGS